MTEEIIVPEEITVPVVTEPDGTFEEWVSYPTEHRFIPTCDHEATKFQQGWWALPGRLTAERVRELGYVPEKVLSRRRQKG